MTAKVFVAGATGVLGRRVVRDLVAAGHDVRANARTDEKAATAEAAGATPVRVDLFDDAAVAGAVEGVDAVVNLATSIPPLTRSARAGAWRTNDRLRTEAAAVLSGAVIDAGVARYVGESITFPYVDRGAEWIDEDTPRRYVTANRSCADAEAAAARVTDAGAVGITLRFAMFHAPDSAHVASFVKIARLGVSPLPGDPSAHVSFVDVDDAAAAVVAAVTEVNSGVYNVAEPEPLRRAAHNDALAAAVGRRRLRIVPLALQRLGGDGLESLSRSHRVSSRRLEEASSWRSTRPVIERWESVT